MGEGVTNTLKDSRATAHWQAVASSRLVWSGFERSRSREPSAGARKRMRCTWMEMERCRLAKTQDDDKYDSKQPTLMDAGFAGRLRGRLSKGCSAVMQNGDEGRGSLLGYRPCSEVQGAR